MATVIDRLHDILTKAGISDDQIVAGLSLTRKGTHSLAGRIGVSAGSVPALLDALALRVGDDMSRAQPITEDGGSDFSLEGPDFLGNVTIRNRADGNTVFLAGSEASELIKALDLRQQDKQAILAKFFAINESAEADIDLDEIKKDNGGSYNFVYNIGSLRGTGTAKFAGSGKTFTVRVISVRDEDGNEIHPTAAQAKLVHDAAVDFIGKE